MSHAAGPPLRGSRQGYLLTLARRLGSTAQRMGTGTSTLDALLRA